jgi:hypothetical protein
METQKRFCTYGEAKPSMVGEIVDETKNYYWIKNPNGSIEPWEKSCVLPFDILAEAEE